MTKRYYEIDEVEYVTAVARAIEDVPIPVFGGIPTRLKVKFYWDGEKLPLGIGGDAEDRISVTYECDHQ